MYVRGKCKPVKWLTKNKKPKNESLRQWVFATQERMPLKAPALFLYPQKTRKTTLSGFFV